MPRFAGASPCYSVAPVSEQSTASTGASTSTDPPAASASPVDGVSVLEAMRPGVVTCLPEDRLAMLAAIMVTHGIHAVVLGPVEERTPLIVTDLDLVRAALERADARASDIAREPAATVDADAPLREAVAMMSERGDVKARDHPRRRRRTRPGHEQMAHVSFAHHRHRLPQRRAGIHRGDGLARDVARSRVGSLERGAHEIQVGHDQRRALLDRPEHDGVYAVGDHDRRDRRQAVFGQARDHARAHRVERAHSIHGRGARNARLGARGGLLAHGRHATAPGGTGESWHSRPGVRDSADAARRREG